jgi:hypothetical protein
MAAAKNTRLIANGLCPKKQFLPLMNTDDTDKKSNIPVDTSTKRLVLISVISANQW